MTGKSLKDDLSTWKHAIDLYKAEEYDRSLQLFASMCTAKGHFNRAVIQATLGLHGDAVESFDAAIALDNYLAVAWFQRGVSLFLMGEYQQALADFNQAKVLLRGNSDIDYRQVELDFVLFDCEVLFNIGLCHIYLGDEDSGLNVLLAAKESSSVHIDEMKELESNPRNKSKIQRIQGHGVIADAIKARAEGYTIFSIPIGTLYIPKDQKVKAINPKDYITPARIVATTNDRDVGFSGTRPGRQQSAPPANRKPQTPSSPPNNPTSAGPPPMTRSQTVRSSAKPADLNISRIPSSYITVPEADPPNYSDRRNRAASEQPRARKPAPADSGYGSSPRQSVHANHNSATREIYTRDGLYSNSRHLSSSGFSRHSRGQSYNPRPPMREVDEQSEECYFSDEMDDMGRSPYGVDPYSRRPPPPRPQRWPQPRAEDSPIFINLVFPTKRAIKIQVAYSDDLGDVLGVIQSRCPFHLDQMTISYEDAFKDLIQIDDDQDYDTAIRYFEDAAKPREPLTLRFLIQPKEA